jgi:DNA-binding PadR family transcriptional regulator
MPRARGHWEVAVLAFLREGPMHPYEMQRLLRARHKDEILSLKRGSLYHAINRLIRVGLIETVSTGRAGRRPQRTTYRLTAQGRSDLSATVRDMVAIPRREPSEFFAGLSFLVYLDPRDAAAQLEERADRLEREIGVLAIARRKLVTRVRRINLLEEEYHLAMRRAELRWVRAVLAELRARKFSWNLDEILRAIRAAKRQR